MSGHTTIILVIAMLVITVGGVVVLYEVSHDYQESVQAVQRARRVEQTGRFELVSVVGTNVSNEGYTYGVFEVRYTGPEQLDLNDTFIQLRTTKSVADLRYRDGQPVRSVADGFYTQ